MNDRDELAREVGASLPDWTTVDGAFGINLPALTDAVWAAGWRKKPNWKIVEVHRGGDFQHVRFDNGVTLWASTEQDPVTGEYHDNRGIDAIFALLDGPTETGDSE